MTTFVLDTDMMSLLQRGDRGVAAHFDRHQPYDVATTIISVEEQLSGWYALLRRAKTPMDLARIYGHMSETVRFLGTLPILTFTVRSGRHLRTPSSTNAFAAGTPASDEWIFASPPSLFLMKRRCHS